jgi:hypothetical protein
MVFGIRATSPSRTPVLRISPEPQFEKNAADKIILPVAFGQKVLQFVCVC